MIGLVAGVKRLILGRAVRTERISHTLLPKRVALPVFASDALSSNAYATQEILTVLSIGGLAFFAYSLWVAVAVVVVLGFVVAAYRLNVHAYPGGGGDYEVVRGNLGRYPSLVVAAALLIDYVLTVAVSISAATANLASSVPWFNDHRIGVAVALIVALTLMNLRGVRESGTLFAIPTYAFIVAVFGMVGYAILRGAGGTPMRAESADWTLVAEQSFTGFAVVFLLARAFAAGTTALTGVEAISNGVPAFRPPKSRNAATTLLMLGLLSGGMLLSITALARWTGVQVAADPASFTDLPPGTVPKTVIVQVADAVFSNAPILALGVGLATALILVLAANTAFNGFPVLASVLAEDSHLPRQMRTRGDRLAYSNGIILLSVAAIALVYAFDASVNQLIQLYIVGVFTAFSLSQIGMTRHWTRVIREGTRAQAARARRSRTISVLAATVTTAVLVIVLASKFTRGAWLVIVAIPLLMLLMAGIRRHYQRVAVELSPAPDERVTLPSRIHAIVLVSGIHKPTLRALAYAQATRPSVLEAVTVNIDPIETQRLLAEWDRRGIAVPIRVLDSPYREITRPVVDYVRGLRRRSPRDLVTVFVPEYVVGHWWEHILHNQSALRLKARLLFTPGVMMVSVPWQLASSERIDDGRTSA